MCLCAYVHHFCIDVHEFCISMYSKLANVISLRTDLRIDLCTVWGKCNFLALELVRVCKCVSVSVLWNAHKYPKYFKYGSYFNNNNTTTTMRECSASIKYVSHLSNAHIPLLKIWVSNTCKHTYTPKRLGCNRNEWINNNLLKLLLFPPKWVHLLWCTWW